MPTKLCAVCGELFDYQRRSALYCSNACKSKSRRLRVNIEKQVTTRTPDHYENADLLAVKAVSDLAYRQLEKMWGVYGKKFASEALEAVWLLMFDCNLIPDDYLKK